MKNDIMKTEILAPGGSLEGIKAAYRAGADAVYTGGAKFGAREYANNLDLNQMEEAINYAHIHNRKLYLTVNTLLKDTEINSQLVEYLKPIVDLGLDAVIVQDFGVLKVIHENYPNLPIHASTQMTIMGSDTSEWLKQYGVNRIVTPREMSLNEIKDIYNNTGLEVESFVHGALCYCYSGQCFMSSYIGGRSGNRGRCAQPCRMEYDAFLNGQLLNKGDSKYILSPKDINTLEIIPDLIESGVYSLKIEGRMKKPEYAAGITALYRKYVDLYYKVGRNGFKVDSQDIKKAFDLFNRNGFSQSYYKQHNSKEMISLKKPSFRQENSELVKNIQSKYINSEIKENINIYINILKGQPVTITSQCGEFCTVTYGKEPDIAQKIPINVDTVIRQFSKLGNTPFEIKNQETDIQVELDDGLFIPMGELNELRRKSIEDLTNTILDARKAYLKNKKDKIEKTLHTYNDNLTEDIKVDSKDYLVEYSREDDKEVFLNNCTSKGNEKNISLSVLVSNIEQLDNIIENDQVDRIYVEADCFGRNKEALKQHLNNRGRQIFLALPRVFRLDDKVTFTKLYKEILNNFDGYLIRNIEEYFYLKSMDLDCKTIVFDYNTYSFNQYAKQALLELSSNKAFFTAPVELNRKEFSVRGTERDELIVYGYMPAMTTANCVLKTCDKCRKNNDKLELKDRTAQYLNVRCVCDYCYNVIYNTKPISLMKFKDDITNLNFERIRLEFTFENVSKVNEIINSYYDSFVLNHKAFDVTDSTRGHFNKGVM